MEDHSFIPPKDTNTAQKQMFAEAVLRVSADSEQTSFKERLHARIFLALEEALKKNPEIESKMPDVVEMIRSKHPSKFTVRDLHNVANTLGLDFDLRFKALPSTLVPSWPEPSSQKAERRVKDGLIKAIRELTAKADPADDSLSTHDVVRGIQDDAKLLELSIDTLQRIAEAVGLKRPELVTILNEGRPRLDELVPVMREQVAVQIRKFLKDNPRTVEEVAEFFQVPKGQAAYILQGNFDFYHLDELIVLAGRIGLVFSGHCTMVVDLTHRIIPLPGVVPNLFVGEDQ